MSVRSLIKSVGEIPPVKRLSIWLADRRTRRWLAANPGKSFADYYGHHVARRLDARRPHPSLGQYGYATGKGAWRRDVSGDKFAAFGFDHWLRFAGFVGHRDQRVVDYGCGSLRLGQHAIRYLDPGCYWGVDPSERFLAEGRALIGRPLAQEKQPHIDPLDEAVVERIRDWRPAIIFSNAVLQHVPETELPTYFRRLARMMVAGTLAAIMFIPVEDEVRRVKAMSWGQSPRLLEKIVADIDPALKVSFAPVAGREDPDSPGVRQMMLIEA